MKKSTIAIIIITLFISAVLGANGTMNRSHVTMKGKDEAKINCSYCHVEAKIPKKKGQNLDVFYKTPFCAGEACHPLPQSQKNQ